jgi:hypothetical protein
MMTFDMSFEEYKKKFPASEELIEKVTYEVLRNKYYDGHELTADQIKGRIACDIEVTLKYDYEIIKKVVEGKNIGSL